MLVGVFTNTLRDYPGLQNIDTDLRLNTPNCACTSIATRWPTRGQRRSGRAHPGNPCWGRQVTRYKDQGEQYDVIVQVVQGDRATPTDISGIYVRARDGSMVQLDNLLSVRESVAAVAQPLQPLARGQVDAAVAPGYALGEVLDHMHRVARDVLPNTVITDLDGQSREFRDSSGSIYLVFAMALAFIYLVLAAQFEELAQSLHHHAVGAAVDDRGVAGAVADRRHAVHLQPDRPDHPGGADHRTAS